MNMVKKPVYLPVVHVVILIKLTDKDKCTTFTLSSGLSSERAILVFALNSSRAILLTKCSNPGSTPFVISSTANMALDLYLYVRIEGEKCVLHFPTTVDVFTSASTKARSHLYKIYRDMQVSG